MTITQSLLAFVLAALGVSLADWLFMGVLFHSRYLAFPEVWRAPDRWRVPKSAAVALLTPAVIVAGASCLGITDAGGLFVLALMLWGAGPLPLLVVNQFFFRLHPLVTAAHVAGWLVKAFVAALAVWIVV